LNKAPDAFRTISEVADELDLPQHVLRFWESRFPHIKPMKRGGGRRYYRREDVDLLRGIRHLLYGDGYTIRGVQRILREQGVRAVQSVGQGHPVALPAPTRDDEGEDDVLEFVPPRLFGATTPRDVEDADPPAPALVPSKHPAGPAVGEAAPLTRSVPPAAASPPLPIGKGLGPEDLDRLKTALADLQACRALLDKANDGGT
jgi:DNA-binding transcriptional MerR regulator